MIRTKHAALLVSLALGAAVGCAQPPVEGKGVATSKLLAPNALLVVNASKATQKAVGISTWKLYRSKKTWILTGYDSKGAAVHGIELSFLAGTKTTPAALHGRWLDGSKLTMQHDFGGTWHSSGKLGSLSKKLVDYARFDLRAADAKMTHHTGTYPHVPAGGGTTTTTTTPPPVDPTLPPTDPSACGGDLTTILTSALACITAAGSNTALASQCVASAESAATAMQDCAGAGTTTPGTDPTGGMCGGYPGDPGAGGGYPGDPGAGGYPGDPGSGGDPGAGGYPGDPGAGGYPGDPGAGGYPGDPSAGGAGACGCADPTNPMCQDPCAASADPMCDPNGGGYPGGAGGDPSAGGGYPGDPGAGGIGDASGAGAAGAAGGDDSCLSCDPSGGDDIEADADSGDVGYGDG